MTAETEPAPPTTARAATGIDPLLLSRIEDASLNASAPREQRWLDGWLVRFCPGKAKRARSIQAVADGRMAVAERIAACRSVYEEAGLPMMVRLTPFSLPAGLDEALAGLGMPRIDDTRVMVKPDLRRGVASAPMKGEGHGDDSNATARLTYEIVEAEPFASWIGGARGSPPAECRAHAARLRDAPVPLLHVLARDAPGSIVAAGQVAIEAELAGLYDIVTAETHRRLGIGAGLCTHLLAQAAARGARTAYLQVDAGNDGARRLYNSLGFADGYAYHYRTMPV